MKEKKTEVITLRTSKKIREKLEQDAAFHGWKIAKMVETIIAEKYDENEDEEEEIAMEVYTLITNKTISTINELTQWAINTNNVDKIGYSAPLWKELINEMQNVAD